MTAAAAAIVSGIVRHHPSSRRFKCAGCARVLTWPQGPARKIRVPERDRHVRCECGVLHMR